MQNIRLLTLCDFQSKSEVGLKIHKTAKHKKEVQQPSDDSEYSDEEDDGPMNCNHCHLNGISPGYVTEDFDDLLRHIKNDHKDNSTWGSQNYETYNRGEDFLFLTILRE